ncbi:20457_t:CDS:2 [Racocetra persica]|uniref:20457_t:CDS:1 n=1 Tax=Racocetra persica TaxID=160502 RepID=A0ACA9NH49_9GLOM|nr:20457_t:CDS:2 [Racocetra persica]
MSDIKSTSESETGGSTSNMNLHLANEYSLVEFQKDKKDNNNDKPSSSQLSVIKMLQRTIPPHKETKKINIHRAVTEWLVIDNRLLDTIKGKGFRHFMLQVDPAFRRPSYKVLRKNISFANTNTKKQIYNLLNETCENVSLTTDLWTSRNNTGYIGITAHWLNKQF